MSGVFLGSILTLDSRLSLSSLYHCSFNILISSPFFRGFTSCIEGCLCILCMSTKTVSSSFFFVIIILNSHLTLPVARLCLQCTCGIILQTHYKHRRTTGKTYSHILLIYGYVFVTMSQIWNDLWRNIYTWRPLSRNMAKRGQPGEQVFRLSRHENWTTKLNISLPPPGIYWSRTQISIERPESACIEIVSMHFFILRIKFVCNC